MINHLVQIINKFLAQSKLFARQTFLVFGALALIFTLSSCAELQISLSNAKKPTTSKKSQEDKTSKLKTQLQPINESKLVNKKKYQIGILVPLSGKNKELGQSLLNSATMALFDSDKNNDIELVVFDSKNTPAEALQAVNEANRRNIKVIIGPVFSTAVEAISETIKANKMVALSFSNNQDLTNRKGIFLMGFLPEQQIDKIVNYSISRGRGNFAIIAPNNPYGLKMGDLLKELVKRKDGNFIISEYYSANGKDLEKVAERITKSFIVSERALERGNKNQGQVLKEEDKIYANAIFVPESGEVLVKVVKALKKYNNKDRNIQIIGTSSWDDISTLNNPDLVGGWFAAPDFNNYKEFERKYYHIFGKFPNRINSIAYDAVLAVLELVKVNETASLSQGKNKELSEENFINYASSRNAFAGIDGLFRFLPNGLVQRNLAVLEVGNGKFEVIDSPSRMFLKY